MFQKTIQRETTISGIGLHTGERTRIKFLPADVGEGVNFLRVDVNPPVKIPATINYVSDAPRRTTLQKDGVCIHTVEHLLAAIAGLGIDNITIEIEGQEVPEIDGSALPYVEALQEAGIEKQNERSHTLRVLDSIWVADGDAHVSAMPHEKFRVSFTIDYGDRVVGSRYLSVDIDEEVFRKELAPARTFCFMKEAEALKAAGLGKGASYDNTIVVGEEGVIGGELRFPDEFVRHKILDLLGDLALLGARLQGHIVAVKSGHSLNVRLVKKLRQVFQMKGLTEPLINIEGIMEILPHRYPFLLIDKIVEIEDDKRIVGIKNVTLNEHFFTGHFPGRPIMPGVLIIEAMAQTAGVLMLRKPENRGKLAYLVSLDKVKFRKPVLPGDQLQLEAEILKVRATVGKVLTRALVGGQVVAEAEIGFSIVDK